MSSAPHSTGYRWSQWLDAGLFGLTYFAAAQVGHWLSIEPGHMATCWPPAGLYLAVLMWLDRSRWLPFVVAAFIANFVSDYVFQQRPAALSVGFASANLMEAVIGAELLRRLSSKGFSLQRLGDILHLFTTAFVAPIFGALAGAVSVVIAYSDQSLLEVALMWWSADFVGIFVITPVVWSLLIGKWRGLVDLSWSRRIELICSVGTVVLVSLLVCRGWHLATSFTFLVIPFMLWPSMRFCPGTTAVSVMFSALVITSATVDQRGPFSLGNLTEPTRVVLVQLYLTSISAPFLALAALIQERQRAAEELEFKVLQRTQQLAEADRRKDHFLAVLAHELRNPLAPLSNALQVWPYVESQAEEMRDLREIMTRQLSHMVHLVDELLDVSRITRGKIQLKQEPLDLREVVSDAIVAVQPMIDASKQSLHVAYDSVPLIVLGDRARLLQVIGNILNNASKFTGPGGNIWITAEPNSQQIALTIKDNGPGISREQLDRIFEMFTQVDQTLERSHGGLGIGLTLARTLVELHGGSLTAHSDGLGCGSKFVVTLNRHELSEKHAEWPQAVSSSGDSQAALPYPPKRVLIVDDVVESAQTLAKMLTTLGHEVRVQHEGEAAIAEAAQWQPEVCFLDIAMPGMNGYEVAKELRKVDPQHAMKLVALTGFGQVGDRELAFAVGFDEHLIKPASLESLREVLQSRLAARSATNV